MIRISTGTQIALIARIALHLSYSDLTTPEIDVLHAIGQGTRDTIIGQRV
jgi:hypothetical protein